MFNGNSSKEKYDEILKRENELKERMRNEILVEDFDDFNSLIETINLRHEMELKAAYEKGIQQGSYYQRIIDCKEDMTEFIGKKADDKITCFPK